MSGNPVLVAGYVRMYRRSAGVLFVRGEGRTQDRILIENADIPGLVRELQAACDRSVAMTDEASR